MLTVWLNPFDRGSNSQKKIAGDCKRTFLCMSKIFVLASCTCYILLVQLFVSSDRSSCADDGLLYIYIYIYPRPLFQMFTQSFDAIDVTSVTLSRLNSINVIDVTRYLGDILGISLGYL